LPVIKQPRQYSSYLYSSSRAASCCSDFVLLEAPCSICDVFSCCGESNLSSCSLRFPVADFDFASRDASLSHSASRCSFRVGMFFISFPHWKHVRGLLRRGSYSLGSSCLTCRTTIRPRNITYNLTAGIAYLGVVEARRSVEELKYLFQV
jgi:hypothetical protein